MFREIYFWVCQPSLSKSVLAPDIFEVGLQYEHFFQILTSVFFGVLLLFWKNKTRFEGGGERRYVRPFESLFQNTLPSQDVDVA